MTLTRLPGCCQHEALAGSSFGSRGLCGSQGKLNPISDRIRLENSDPIRNPGLWWINKHFPRDTIKMGFGVGDKIPMMRIMMPTVIQENAAPDPM